MNQTNYVIAVLKKQELDRVWAIEQQAHESPWSETMIRDLSHQNSPKNSKHQFGLFVNDELVGYCYIQNIVGEISLLTIAVDPKQQGKGYGRALMEFLVEHGEQVEAESIWLEVRESNVGAFHLYESLGFNEVDRRVNYYPSNKSKNGKEDAVIMNYMLDDDYNPFA